MGILEKPAICMICGEESAKAYWDGCGQGVKVEFPAMTPDHDPELRVHMTVLTACRKCAIEVLPRLIADAVMYYSTTQQFESQWMRATVNYWQSACFALERAHREEAARRQAREAIDQVANATEEPDEDERDARGEALRKFRAEGGLI